MSRCQAITRKGNQCKYNAIEGSLYCHILPHQNQAKNNTNISDKKPIYCLWPTRKQWSILVALTSLIIGVLTWFSGVTKSDVKESEKNVIQGHKDILGYLKRTEKANREDLMKKYPLGYALFYKDSIHPMIPWNENISKDVLYIKWDSLKILEINEKYIVFLSPFFVIRDKEQLIGRNYENIVKIYRETGEVVRLFGIGNVQVNLEMLVSKKNEFIVAMGFAKR